jgi:hypothetical protein
MNERLPLLLPGLSTVYSMTSNEKQGAESTCACFTDTTMNARHVSARAAGPVLDPIYPSTSIPTPSTRLPSDRAEIREWIRLGQYDHSFFM